MDRRERRDTTADGVPAARECRPGSAPGPPCGRQAEPLDHRRVQLAGVPDRPVPDPRSPRTGPGATAPARRRPPGRRRRRYGRSAGPARWRRPRRRRARPPTSRPGRQSPASTTATCRGWTRQAGVQHGELGVRRAPVDRRSTGGCGASGPGRNTWPISNSARSRAPRDDVAQHACPAVRAAAWCAAAGRSASSGLHQPAAAGGCRRRAARARRNRRFPTNGKDSTSVSPADARSAATARRRRCRGGQPGAGGAHAAAWAGWCRSPPAGRPPRPGRPAG